MPAEKPQDDKPQLDAGGPAAVEPKRLMTYSARYEVLAANVKEAVDGFLKKVEELGGYLSRRENAAVTCRVPASRFQELVRAMPSFGAILEEALEAYDVTKQHLDLKIRIENAEKARQRLLALLEKADKVDDILKIEGEVRKLTEEIERLQGELKYLEDRIAYSTVQVHFRALAPEVKRAAGETRSRFEWINEVGVENVLDYF